jgi:diguanylate cyclase (GGDEF)-like protein
MVEGVAVLDAAGGIAYANARGAALVGVPGSGRAPESLRRVPERGIAEVDLLRGRVAEVSAARIEWEGEPATLFLLRDITDRLRTQASLLVMTEELRSANAHLRMLTEIDPLTGLLNRRGLKRVLEAELLPRVRLGYDLVAIMVDCDGFKAVNDDYDHVAGDLVLRQVAERIRSALRPGDPLVRVGGDEFLVLLPGARHADALRVANRIREVVAAGRIPIPFRQSEVALTVSVGVAQIPRHVRDADDIVSRADSRLRQSKTAGKNRVTGPQDGSGRDGGPQV